MASLRHTLTVRVRLFGPLLTQFTAFTTGFFPANDIAMTRGSRAPVALGKPRTLKGKSSFSILTRFDGLFLLASVLLVQESCTSPYIHVVYLASNQIFSLCLQELGYV